MPVSNEHTFDHEKPIPPFFSRYPKRSPEELQHLMRNSRQAARASTTLLREAANLAKYVKDDEHWIAKYSEKKVLTASKRTAAIAAAEAIANVSQDATMCPVSDTTGGHSNTNHAVPWIYTNDFYQTPDVESNRIRELMRNRLDRIRLEQPESRTEERWDKPRAPGERRRRIVRDKDAPEAPAEPRPSGYTLFVFLMTTKLRHDRGPDVEHSQAEILQQISHHWRVVLKEKEQEHYNRMVQEIRQEYQEQMLEFRATDAFRPSERFIKLGDGQGPWVHKNPEERNELEAEVASYETVVFPPRPKSQDQAYHERELMSRERRKEKLRFEAEERQARKRAVEDALLAEGKIHRRVFKRKRCKQDESNDTNDKTTTNDESNSNDNTSDIDKQTDDQSNSNETSQVLLDNEKASGKATEKPEHE